MNAVSGCSYCESTGGPTSCPYHSSFSALIDPNPLQTAWNVFHRHVWRYDGKDTLTGEYIYHCDEHDPPVVRKIVA